MARFVPVGALGLGVLQTILGRLQFSSDDAVSYLDVADAYRHHHWRGALNGYWSPLYSWILALAAAVVRPSPAAELVMLRAVNLVIYVTALAAFDRFLRKLMEAHGARCVEADRDANPILRIPTTVWVMLGYGAFTFAALGWIGVRSDTPDMLTMALVIVMAGTVLSARTGERPYMHLVLLGVAGGLAYLSKTAMFAVALVFVIVGAVGAGPSRRVWARIGVGLAAFGLVAAPFALSISLAHGRPTIGDTGMLNYAWYVNPTRRVIPNEHWQGGPSGYGVSKHPTRRIWTHPDVFEFGGPVSGTYPPWTDPSYWYEGLTVRLDGAAQLAVAWTNLQFYNAMFGTVVVTFYLCAFCLGGLKTSLKSTLRDQWPLVVPAAVGLVLYVLATDLPAATVPGQPSTRMVAGFVVLLFSAMLSALRLPDSPLAATVASRAAALTLTGVAAVLLTTMLREPGAASAAGHRPLAVAEALHDIGVPAGSKVAILGRKYDRDHDHEFWARLARVQIICQVPDDQGALQLPRAGWHLLTARIGRTGANAIVYKPPSDRAPGTGWLPLNGGYYVYRLPDAAEEGSDPITEPATSSGT